jgi:acetyl esterase/lipase
MFPIRHAEKFAALSLLVVALACGSLAAPASTAAPVTATLTFTPTLVPATETPAPPTVTAPPPTPLTVGMALRDVIYCTLDGLPLRMDILYPFTGYGPWPVVIYIHGGAWMGGSKIDFSGDIDLPALRQAGYMTVAVSYRLAPEYPFPAMIEDIKCAVRYLRANADEYNLDPNRIGARGSSAGGHLVSLLGLADESAGWDVGPYLDQSSRVQAVVDMYGPTDLGDPAFSGPVRHAIFALLGVSDPTDELLALASPLTYVTPDDPPFLILHGDQDDLVNLGQSQKLYDALAKAGVPAELIIVQGAGHGLKPLNGDYTVPTRAQVTELMIAFLDRCLKPAP